MTDTNTLAPTDADLRVLLRQHAPEIGGTLSFARAVLAKWGTPAPVVSEPDPMLPETKYNLGWSAGWDAHARAHPPEKPVVVPAGMEPFGIWHEGETETESDFYLFKDSGDVACPTCIKLFTASQVQAMLAAARNAPPQDPDAAAFAAWCCEMDGITAAPKGGQHAE